VRSARQRWGKEEEKKEDKLVNEQTASTYQETAATALP
jgi:hypothetical protein